DPQAISTLIAFQDASDAAVRRGIANALRNTKSIIAIDGLLHSLRDSDADVRYTAVIALAEITHRFSLGASVDLFRSQEDKYLTYWKEKYVPGDINGDSKVTCDDLAILRGSFGKKAGDAGFDSRSDIDFNGVVDPQDLAFVAQHRPSGSECSAP